MTSLLSYRDAAMAPVMDEFNRLFDSLFSSDSLHSVRSRGRSGYPKLDVIETDKEYVVEAAIPGVNVDDLKVEVVPVGDDRSFISASGHKITMGVGKMLKISGKMDYGYQYPDGAIFHLKELRRSQFVREVSLPEQLDGDPVATYEAGVLKLVWAKPEQSKKVEARLIPITTKTA